MDMMSLLKTRRTYRRFDTSKPVSKEIISDMKNALRFSSSACNAQVLKYIFISDKNIIDDIFPFTHWAGALPKELGTPKAGERPVLFVAVLYDNCNKSKWTDTDAGIAISNLTMAAWSHGIGSCIMDNIDRDDIKKVLEISSDTSIHSLVAFGYPTHSSTVVFPKDDSLKYYLDDDKNYYVPKRPINEFIFENKLDVNID